MWKISINRFKIFDYLAMIEIANFHSITINRLDLQIMIEKSFRLYTKHFLVFIFIDIFLPINCFFVIKNYFLHMYIYILSFKNYFLAFKPIFCRHIIIWKKYFNLIRNKIPVGINGIKNVFFFFRFFGIFLCFFENLISDSESA